MSEAFAEYLEVGLLKESDCYKKILLDGCIVKKGDAEISDLRFFMKKYKNETSPKLQVYKSNLNGKEFIKDFYNFDEAINCFRSLIKGVVE
jgi:hypothetical protein